MDNKIYLGVDGGNTKTDFLAFGRDGKCLAFYRMGTCSHETLNGYEQAGQELDKGLSAVCAQAEILREDISYAVFGLAGADVSSQYRELNRVIESLIPGKFLICNDSVLGIKAAAPGGIGVCCINGTGASVSGIDEEGVFLQNTGVGFITSDFAGGGFLSQEVLRRVYNQCCRDGRKTSLTSAVMDILKLKKTTNLMEAFHPCHLSIRKYEYELDCALFKCAASGDEVAREVIDISAAVLADSTAGCIKRMKFSGFIPVILAGSIWVKSDYPPLIEKYKEELEQKVKQKLRYIMLEDPPVLGAVLWAMERDMGCFLDGSLQKHIAEGIKSRVRNI